MKEPNRLTAAWEKRGLTAWEPQAVEALVRLVEAGMSGSQISVELYTLYGRRYSRAAVLKKVACMELKLLRRPGQHFPADTKAKPKRIRPKEEPRLRLRSTTSTSSFPPAIRTLGEPGAGVPFTELGRRCCKWELGGVEHHARAFLFCGAPQAVKGDKYLPYCTEHMLAAYQPYKRRA